MRLFDPRDRRPVHFMGIAGAGMSALALIARRRGIEVSGCDISLRDAGDIIEAGARVYVGHDPAHVHDARALIYTAAVTTGHAEVQAATVAGMPVLRRAEALGELVRGACVVAVAGTHGKTTTTTMVTEALAAAGCHPTGITGGRVANWGGNARLDGDNLFVVEADEFDRSFLELDPTIAIVNNVEADHLECYGSLSALEDAFVTFAGRARRVLIGADDEGAMRVAGRLTVPVWTVGTDSTADVRLVNVVQTPSGTEADVQLASRGNVKLELTVPGLHNLRNAAMAVTTAWALDADARAAASALREFSGVGRRFEIVGGGGGVTVIDDYAHHPSEIVATLEAARQRFPNARVVAVFQPHLYSRTQRHGAALGEALASADHVVVTEVYPSREAPIAGVTGRIVVDAVLAAGGTVEWVPSLSDVPAHLEALVQPHDVVLMLGAGDITVAAGQLARRLAGEVVV